MIDENTVHESTVEPTTTEQPNVATEEQMAALRDHLFKVTAEAYKKFIYGIKILPVHQEAFHQALLFFDTGMLWVKEAIFCAPLVNSNPTQNTEEKKEESVN